MQGLGFEPCNKKINIKPGPDNSYGFPCALKNYLLWDFMFYSEIYKNKN